MNGDTPVKRKNDSPTDRKSKKPRTSEGSKEKHSKHHHSSDGSKEKHSKPRTSEGKKDKDHKSRKSSDKDHATKHSHNKHHDKPRELSDLASAEEVDGDDNAGAVSPYRKMFPTLHMAVPPVFAADPARAIAELFDTMLLQYVPELEGVLVTHQADPQCFQRQTARIEADGAYGLAPAKVGSLVWSPRIGMKLQGKIILSSPSHVSLLLDGLFNASISSSHIDLSEWEFLHNDSEEDPAAGENGEGEGQTQSSSQPEQDDEQPQSLGFWRNKHNSSLLGGDDGKVTFTVVSMTVAKHMLTLHGSLLKRPFSVPPPDDQDQSADAMLPSVDSDVRTMNASQKLMYDRKLRLMEQRRLRKEKEDVNISKSQGKKVRWDDDESEPEENAPVSVSSNPPASHLGAATSAPQGTKITFD